MQSLAIFNFLGAFKIASETLKKCVHGSTYYTEAENFLQYANS
jgi:hypothetical protein